MIYPMVKSYHMTQGSSEICVCLPCDEMRGGDNSFSSNAKSLKEIVCKRGAFFIYLKSCEIGKVTDYDR